PPPAPPAPAAPEGPGAAAEATLKIVSGAGAGESATVHRTATIGRDEGTDLRVLDPEVSRRHAQVSLEDGTAWIDDLGSLNGTFVNGERVIEHQRLFGG